MFAQIAYQQKLGNSGLTLAEAGCFVTAFANILEKVGVAVDPPTLNNYFTSRKLYQYDQQDHANDDLYWGAVTKYCPQLLVASTGGANWPTSDLSIVEFHYRSVQHPTLPNGQPNMITHFCAVNHAADHSIIDSYDGQVKEPAHYEAVYGQPIAWATYEYHTPQATPPETPPAAPVSAPAAIVPTPAPTPAPVSPKQLFMPQTDHFYLWHVYKVGGPWTLPYAIGALDPYHNHGLTYDILGNPAPNIYLIKTQSFGEVAVYAGPDTVAQFPGSGHGEGDASTETGVPVSEVVPAPTLEPSPAESTAPADAPQAPEAPTIVYARFEAPMSLVTNKDTQYINFVSGTIAAGAPAGTSFEAVGKATLANGDVYFMDENSFGIADETQRTPITVGIKTIDLSPVSSAPAVNTTASAPTEIHVSSSVDPASADAPAEPVLAPINSVRPWQETFEPIIKGDSKTDPTPVSYFAKFDIDIYDLETGNNRTLVKKGAPVKVVGTVIFAGHTYYLPRIEFVSHTWRCFPVTALKRQDATNTPFNTGDDIDQLGAEAEAELSKAKHAAIKAGASAQGFLSRFHKK